MKKKQEVALAGLLEEFSLKKDIEIRAKMEKDRINKMLRDIQKSKLTALEEDKKRELERLAAQREAVRLQEESLHDQVHKLTNEINERE